MLAALLRPIFNADDRERARVGRQRLDRFRTPVRKEAALLEGAEKARSLLPFPGLPRRHSLSLRSANLLERIHREIRKMHRRLRHLPEGPRPDRLVAGVVIEMNAEWLAGRRYLFGPLVEPLLAGRSTDQERKQLNREELTTVTPVLRLDSDAPDNRGHGSSRLRKKLLCALRRHYSEDI
jgi:hypothetical protein